MLATCFRVIKVDEIPGISTDEELTLQERSCKVDTHVGVPLLVWSCVYHFGDLLSFELLHIDENAVAGPEAHDDFGNPKEE